MALKQFGKLWNKEENSTPSGSGASKKRKYHYADILSFLKPVAEKRNTSGNFVDDPNESLQGEQTFDENHSLADETQENGVASTSYSQLNKKSKKTLKETISPFQNKLLSFIEQTGSNDSDKQFLLSLLPDYKNLNPSQKLDFCIYVLNFFLNLHQPDNNSSSSLTYDNFYQNSASIYIPPLRQPDINNTYYSNTSHNIPSPYH
ncbi:uncharacterized protein LOC126555589 [Aphis gossypii]|uniref:uncharacterized protein LOC126555589 n=1 Tax=Aphis gossypii TaxID=80765 RepID=UPI002158BB04|nr:uncharacterized protein LOC126555589 [Aphis gossypii]